MNSLKPILVTGIHRSGSTWLGKTLALAPELRYVHEPFNPKINVNIPFSTWYLYLNKNTELQLQERIKNYINSFRKLSPKELIASVKKAKYLGQIRDAFIDQLSRKVSRPLYKDPIALLSAEWMHKEMNSSIIISVRHPAAFVASLKVANWHFNFNNFLDQPELMSTYFASYSNQIEGYAKKPPSIIDQGILLWNCLYTVVNSYHEKYKNHSDWSFVRHEDLSLKPLEKYKELFSQHYLSFTPKIANSILQSTQSTEKKFLSLNAKENITTWKTRLSIDEIERIKKGTNMVWPLFYSKEEW